MSNAKANKGLQTMKDRSSNLSSQGRRRDAAPLVLGTTCADAGIVRGRSTRVRRLIAFVLLFVHLAASGQEPHSATDVHPVNTFSIVAFDPATGDLGIAVASKVLGVGAIVPFAKANVGAIATQSAANTGYGPEGLKLMESGKSAVETLQQLT